MSRNFCCGGVSSRNSLVEMYAGYPWLIKDVLIGSYKMSEQESKPSRDRNRRWDATKPLMGDPRKLGSAVDCVGHKGGSITGI